MKLIQFSHWEDFGQEYDLKVLHNNHFCLLRFHLSTSDFFEFWPPNFTLNLNLFSYQSLFRFGINIWTIHFEMEFWSDLVNLDHYK
jgi:hypothetical protein